MMSSSSAPLLSPAASSGGLLQRVWVLIGGPGPQLGDHPAAQLCDPLGSLVPETRHLLSGGVQDRQGARRDPTDGHLGGAEDVAGELPHRAVPVRGAVVQPVLWQLEHGSANGDQEAVQERDRLGGVPRLRVQWKVEGLGKLARPEADDARIANDRHRNRTQAESPQIVHGRAISLHVALHELHAVVRKELLRPGAGSSALADVYGYSSDHTI